MPLSDINFGLGDQSGDGLTTSGDPNAASGGNALLAQQSAGGTLVQISGSGGGGSGCTSLPATLPPGGNAPGSNYPGQHWRRWDGVIGGGAMTLGVDDGILENCLAAYAPITYGTYFNRRLCVLDDGGEYYVAGTDTNPSFRGSENPATNVTTQPVNFVFDAENCP